MCWQLEVPNRSSNLTCLAPPRVPWLPEEMEMGMGMADEIVMKGADPKKKNLCLPMQLF